MSVMKSYSELITFLTFEERLNYLKTHSKVGETGFGWRRYVNQTFYKSDEWKDFKRDMIVRDNGCDLGLLGFEIYEPIVLHHINPITYEDIVELRPCVLDPENVICTRDQTHKAIHYSSDSIVVPGILVTRRPNDTCPWK